MSNETIKQTKLDTDEELIEKTPKKGASQKKVAKKFDSSDLIECRSVTGGRLILIGPKTKFQYNWEDYGDVTEVEYQDLLSLQSRKSGFLVKPRFIIEDEELVEQWSSMLKPIYDKIITQDIEDFLNLPINKFRAQLKVIPEGLQDAIKTKVAQMIKNDELYDIRKAREIDEAWGTDFVGMFVN